MGSRHTTAWIGLVLSLALVASTVFFALQADGREGSEASSNDGGAWLVNRRAGSVGHVNRQVRELSAAVQTGQAGSAVEVYQPLGAVVVHDASTDTLAVVDERWNRLANTIEVPGDATIVRYDGGLVIHAGDPFRLWAIENATLGEIQTVEGVEPLYQGGPSERAIGVSAAGRVLIADPANHQLISTGIGAPEAQTIALPPELGTPDQVSFDGDQALVRAGERVARVVDGRVDLLAATTAPWHTVGTVSSQATGSIVVVTDSSRLLRIDSETGETAVLGDLVGERPVPPIEHRGCVHALVHRPAELWMLCGNDAPKVTALDTVADAELRLRLVNDWIWVNDLTTGSLWLVDVDGDVVLIDDWGSVLPNRDSDESDDPVDADDDVVEDILNPDAEDVERIEADEFDDDDINEPPVARDDPDGAGHHYTHIDRPVVIDVIANDSDPDNDVLLITSVDLSSGEATVTRSVDGTKVQVSPNPGYLGNVRFRYTISDGRGGSDSATGSVMVEQRTGEVNQAPVPVTDTTTVTVGSRTIIDVLVNDYDPDGDSLVVVDATAPQGTVSFDPSGRLIFEPESTSEEGEIELAYTVVDDFGEPAQGRVRVAIRLEDSNQPPDARNDGALTVVGQPVTINLLDNDSDPDGDDLFVAQRPEQVSPTGIDVYTTITPDGEFVVIPDQPGTYIFTYSASDDEDSDTAQIRLDVEAAGDNRPPIAVRDDLVVPQGESRIVYALANDGDPDGDVVGIVDLNVPPNSGMRVEQYLDIGFRVFVEGPGPARRTFRYAISDGRSDPVETSVVVSVAETDNRDQPPIAQADTVEIRPGATVVVPVLDNDFDPEGGVLRVVSATTIGGGTATIGPANQSVRVGVLADTTTSFNISYDIVDEAGNRAGGLIRVRVVSTAEPNRPPIARPDAMRVPFETQQSLPVSNNDSDPDGDAIQVESIAEQPINGVAEVDRTTGEVLYRPADGYSGSDRFTYTLIDALGARANGEVLIGVMPRPEPNRDPVALDDSQLAVANGDPIEISVLDNDSDPDGDQLRIHTVGSPRIGQVTRHDSRPVLLYRPPFEQAGDETVTFDYTIVDGNGGQATATVTVLVQQTPPKPPGSPTAVDDQVARAGPGDLLVVDVVANDSDPDDPIESLTVTVFDDRLIVVGQAVELRAPTESETFIYRVTDPSGKSDIGLIDVTVIDPKPPVAIDDQAGPVTAGEQVRIDVLANDFDEDGRPEELELIEVLGVGARIDGRQVVIDAGAESAQYGYTIHDLDGLTASAIIAVIVTENRAPVIEPASFETPFEEPIEIDLAPFATDPDGDALLLSCCQSARNGSPQVIEAGENSLLVEFTPDAGFSGDAVFTFEANDQFGHLVAGSVTVVVGPQPNRPPVADDGEAEIQVPRPDGPPIAVAVDLAELSTDPDPDDELTWQITTEPGSGLSVAIDGSILEIVATEDSDPGPATVGWAITDAEGESASATISVTVLEPQNETPTADPSTVEVAAGNTTIVDLADLSADADPDDQLTWEIQAAPPDGVTITQTGPSAVTVAAAFNVTGTATGFDYTVTDRLGEQAGATVEIAVGVPDRPPPVANDDQANTIQDQAVEIPVLANDVDPIGQGLTIVDPGGTADGTVTIQGDVLRFLPLPTFFGQTEFIYTIRDFADIDEREASAVVTIEVTGRPDAPAPPACSPDSRIAALTWTAPAGNGAPITSYLIEHDQGGADSLDAVTSHQWIDLINGTEYRFRLAAENLAGTGEWSDWSTPCTPDIEPEQPAAPQVTHGDGWLEVSWTEPTNHGSAITEYELRIGGGAVQTSTGTSLRWEGLENGTDYTFQVAARNAKGRSPFSAASAPEHPSTVPAAPVIGETTRAGLTGAQASGILQVNWTPVPVADDGGDTITEYRIERRGATGASTPGANTASYIWPGLPNGVDYEFRVIAINRDGESPPSAWSTPLQACTVPGAPTAVGASAGDRQARVDFGAPADDGGCAITDYEVTIDGAAGSTVNWASGGRDYTGLVNGETYVFQVRANNAVGAGQRIDTPAVTPKGLPICHQNFRLISITRDGATVSWGSADFNGGIDLGYELNINSAGWTSVGSVESHVLPLAGGIPYTVRMRAVNDVGTDNCGTVSFESCPSTPPTPSAPSLSANQTNRTATTTWSAVSVPCTSQPEVSADFDIVRYELDPDPGAVSDEGLDRSKTYSLSAGDTLRVRVRACFSFGCGAWSAWSPTIEIESLGTISIQLGPATNWSESSTNRCFPGASLFSIPGADPSRGCYWVQVTLAGWDGSQQVHCYRTMNNEENGGFWEYYGGARLSNGTHNICSYTQAGRAVAVTIGGSLSDQPNRTINVSPPTVASNMIDPWPTN